MWEGLGGEEGGDVKIQIVKNILLSNCDLAPKLIPAVNYLFSYSLE